MRAALIEPMREIYGVSDKVLAMALSALLLGAPEKMVLWTEVGGSMIAIDTLVHNFCTGPACEPPSLTAGSCLILVAEADCAGHMQAASPDTVQPTADPSGPARAP
jgi:hypothetical protein